MDELVSFDLVNKMPDPLLSFKWVVLALPSFGGITLPREYVEAVNLPFYNTNIEQEVFIAGSYLYFPGFQNITATDITFYEDKNLTTTLWLEAWRKAIRNPDTGLYYLPASYKRDVPVALLDQGNNTILTATLKGIWPAARGQFDLTYTDNSRIRIQQNFSVDDQDIK